MKRVSFCLSVFVLGIKARGASRYSPENAHTCRQLLRLPIQRRATEWGRDLPLLPAIDGPRAIALIRSRYSWGTKELEALEQSARAFNVQLPETFRLEDLTASPRTAQALLALGEPKNLVAFLRGAAKQPWLDPEHTSVLVPAEAAALPPLPYGPHVMTITSTNYKEQLKKLLDPAPEDRVIGINLSEEGMVLVRVPPAEAQAYLEFLSGTPAGQRRSEQINVENMLYPAFVTNLRGAMVGEARLTLNERNHPRATLISPGEFIDYARAAVRSGARMPYPHRIVPRALRRLLIESPDELQVLDEEHEDASLPAEAKLVADLNTLTMSRSELVMQQGWRHLANEKSKHFLSVESPARVVVRRESGRTNTPRELIKIAMVVSAQAVREGGVAGVNALSKRLTGEKLAADFAEQIQSYVNDERRLDVHDFETFVARHIDDYLKLRGVSVFRRGGEDAYLFISSGIRQP